MAVTLLATIGSVLGQQIPLFLLGFGMFYLALAYTVKPLGDLLSMPIAVFMIVLAVAWFTVSSGSIMAMPISVMEVLGFGIVLIVLGKVFSGV